MTKVQPLCFDTVMVQLGRQAAYDSSDWGFREGCWTVLGENGLLTFSSEVEAGD